MSLMSTPEQPPQQTPPALPTQQDVAAIFERANTAAERAETAAGRLEAAQSGARQETEARFPDMPEQVLKQISEATAAAVVGALNAQFDVSGQQAVASGGDATSSENSGSAQNPAGSSDAGGSAPPPEPAPNLARRILGY